MPRPRARSPGGASIEPTPENISRRPPFVHARSEEQQNTPVPEPHYRLSDFGRQDPAEGYQASNSPLLTTHEPQIRTPSLLQRLGTIKTPTTPIARMLTRKRTNNYDRLGDEEGDIGDMSINVDLSSLGGNNFELAEVQEIEQPRMSILQPVEEEERGSPTSYNLQKLGSGMIIGAQLNVDPPSSQISRALSSSQNASTRTSEIQRAKTIRQAGQQAAQKRNVIVAITQPVDLSSFEHVDSPAGDESRPESTYLSSRRDTELTKSYYYPQEASPPNWKPFSMQPTYIILLILISASLAGVQEWLCQRSLAMAKEHHAILEFNSVMEVSLWNFFCWKYLPTLIFVVYGVFWQSMDFDIRRLEPFYQLSQPNGSTAEESLNMDYMTMFSFLIPVKAFKYKQWAVLCSSIGTLLATSLSATLQNPSVVFRHNNNCIGPDCPEGQKHYLVQIQPVWSRCLSVSLLATAIVGIILLLQLRRRSGLLNDPRGIAGIASMATRSHILGDFKGLDTADEMKIHKRLQHRRYVMHKSSIWQGEYIQHSQSIQEPEHQRDSHPMMLRMKTGWAFIGLLTACLLLIPIINFTPARVIPNAVPWLPVLVATIIKMMWSTLDFNIRMIEPFYILSNGYADVRDTLTLDYRGTPPGIMPIKALLERHPMVALVGFGSILTDILTVIVSSFSVNSESFIRSKSNNSPTNTGDETFKSFWGSVILSVLIVLILMISAFIIYWRRGQPFLPRQPNTIASVLAFVFASNMLMDFVETGGPNTGAFSSRQLENKAREENKKYGLGWFIGLDKKAHVAIDDMNFYKTKFIVGAPHDWVQAPGPMDSGYS